MLSCIVRMAEEPKHAADLRAYALPPCLEPCKPICSLLQSLCVACVSWGTYASRSNERQFWLKHTAAVLGTELARWVCSRKLHLGQTVFVAGSRSLSIGCHLLGAEQDGWEQAKCFAEGGKVLLLAGAQAPLCNL